MAFQDTLIHKHTSVWNASYVDAGGSVTKVGADPGTSGDSANAIRKYKNNVCSWNGEIYAVARAGSSHVYAYRYNFGTGLWVQEFDSGSLHFRHTGIYEAAAPSGTGRRIFFVYFAGGSTFRIVYSDDGLTWSSTNATLGGNHDQEATCCATGEIMFGDKLYFVRCASNVPVAIYEVDPFTLSIAQLTGLPFADTNPGSQGVNLDFAVLDNTLYVLAPDFHIGGGTAADWALYQFTGAGFAFNTQITSDNRLTDVNANQGQVCLFKPPEANKLIAICNGQGAAGAIGMTAFELTPSGSAFTVNDITSTYVPAAKRPGGGSTNAEDRIFVQIENDTDPTNPTAHVWISPGPATTNGWEIYPHANTSTELTGAISGPGNVYAPVSEKFGGGLRLFPGTAAANKIHYEYGTKVDGAFRVYYRVQGTTLGQVVRLYYSEDEETPFVLATLSAQSGGSGITANAVTGVDGDDGATLYWLEWDLTADGLPNANPSHLVLDIRAS